ncbi:hypothetical protein, partial [Ralstonia pseudosolanacearum]|uniref:hypothetical protein n=3 Tax=Ralstonia TaxID=48736 RepID=UPI001E31C967
QIRTRRSSECFFLCVLDFCTQFCNLDKCKRSAMKKYGVGVVLAGLMICGNAQEPKYGFVKVAESEEMVLFVNVDSYRYRYLADIQSFGAVVQIFRKMGGGSSFRKEYVLEPDCRRGYGRLYSHGLDDRNLQSYEWLKDSGTVASIHAEVLCHVSSWDKPKK